MIVIGIDCGGRLYVGYFGRCTECQTEFSKEDKIETPFQPGYEEES